jgi:serine protease AprX
MLKVTRITVLIFTASMAFARQPKISKELENLDPSSTADVIVQFTQTPTNRHHQKVLSRGGVFKNSLHLIKGGAYSVPARSIWLLASDPEVVHISPDRKLKSMLDLTDSAVNAGAAWTSGWTGIGVAVAVIDSGISSHPDLDNRIVYKQDFVGGGTDDHFGHGQHVAGIIAGSGKSSTCSNCTRLLKGIAPGANVLDLRVLDQNGSGTDSSVIAAIQQAISLKTKYNIRVINLSLGRPVYESYTQDPLCQAVEAAWNAGIVVVVAAGNSGRDNSQGTNGYATITAPGNDPYVITVGAMKTMGTAARYDDLIASYSSKGPTSIDHVVKPDIVAPGNQVVSLLAGTSHFAQMFPNNIVPLSYYQNTTQTNSSNVYFTLSGTSMATPVVSGAVADLLQAQPSLTPDQVKAKLMLTAYKNFPSSSIATDPVTGAVYTSQYDIFTVGAGYLDIQAALNDPNVAVGTALSPTANYDAMSGFVYLMTDPSAVWDTRAVWAVRAVWSTSEVDATRAVWGTQAVWGSSSLDGFRAVWTTRAVWAVSTTDATEATLVTINGEQ